MLNVKYICLNKLGRQCGVSYNSEIWGSFLKTKGRCNFTKFKDNLFDESHKHEQLLNRLSRYTFGIPKKSSNNAAKGELGIYHLNIGIRFGSIKFCYSKVKKEYREESYTSAVEYRSVITRFRISAHNLPVEKGRWKGINKTERKCKNASIMMKTTTSYAVMNLI